MTRRLIASVVALMTTAFVSTSVLALGEPQHSKVDASAAKTDDQLTLTFKIVNKDGIVVNMEGPWKLDLSKVDDLKLAKTSFDKSDMDEKMPGFTVVTKPAKIQTPKGGHVAEYRLTAFVCTKDKTQCFREVHKGEVRW